MSTATDEEIQPCLFDSLPETEPRRRRTRRKAGPAKLVAAESVTPNPADGSTDDTTTRDGRRGFSDGGATPPPPTPPPPTPAPLTLAALAAGLTNPDLAEMVRSLSDGHLGFLITEAARELRRRTAQPDWDERAEGEQGEAGNAAPNPALVRAAQRVVSELAGDDGGGF
ncbi:conserved hypothetical protein [uncultured Gammaproteobacteria bacterium]